MAFASSDQGQAGSPADAPSVYLVEDDPALALSVKFLFDSENLKVRHFPTADHFLAAVHGLDAGCLLIDVCMPGTDGVAALQRFRALGYRWPVVVMTAACEAGVEDLAWASGATGFLHKPVAADDMLSSIKRLLCLVPPGRRTDMPRAPMESARISCEVEHPAS
jgi:FixJ family two-component response regulator